MGKDKHDDENITVLPEESYERHLEKHPGKDTKSEIKNVILEMEEHSMVFSRDEIIKHAAKLKLPKAEIDAVIDNFISEGYLIRVVGSENLLTRSVWRDFSPAFEESFDY